jgi:CHAT domain-containing protein/tetratricopeptide (TPR) repeat protein
MPSLIAVRNPIDIGADDLLWPSVTRDLRIRMEPGEVVSWRGLAEMAEVRHETGGKLERVWRTIGPAEYTITNHRIFYKGQSIERGSGRLAKIAWCLCPAEVDSPTAIAAGQVRFQWPAMVSLNSSRAETTGVFIKCQDGTTPVSLVMLFSEATLGQPSETTAANMARLLVTEIARFRLEARAGQLEPEYVSQLTMQRDNPTPVEAGSELRWVLQGGLIIGQPPRSLPRRPADPRLDRLSEDAESALKRYIRRGRTADLETSLQLGKVLLTDAPADSPDRLAYMNLYAGALNARYEQSGDMSDLTAAIDMMREVARRTDLEHQQWLPGALSNLGTILTERWQRALDERDLEEAIAAQDAAVAATPRDSEDWAIYASNLGVALRARYPLTENVADVDRAIRLYEEILSRITRRSPDKGDYVANLGNALLDRHRITNNRDDLNRAINALQDALKLIPRGAPARSVAQMALADAMTRLRTGVTKSADLNSAVNAWRKICQEGHASSQVKVLQAALNWSSAMAKRRDWATVVEACDFGLAAADRLFHLQLAREHKGLWLEEARQLPALAAYALAKLGELQRAAVTLERGRALFLSEALGRDHANLDRLAALGHNDLRERYQHAADWLTRMERAGQGGAPPQAGATLSGEDAEAARRARIELDQAVAAIRMVSGYETFLAPPTYRELTWAAATSALVYIAITEAGGFALIIDGRGGDTAPTVVWLNELTESTLMSLLKEYLSAYEDQLHEDSRQRWRDALDSVTRRLWEIVIAPILDAAPTDRLTLVPGDVLGLFPLHAAWKEDASTPIGRRYALDDALITYAPSARGLSFAQQVAGQSTISKILVVYDPSLPSSGREIEAIAPWFNEVKELRRDHITLEMVRAALSEYPVLHFSCHGSASITDPLASSLAVASDGNLTLRDLFEQRLRGTRLAVLSACETALVGTDIPEEAIGLPSGLLQAGAAGVLGSLWPVGDAATCALMTRFYELWRGDGLEPAHALRQAQQWMRDTCVPAKEIHFSEVISSGNETHVHPTHWAAFTYTGV